MSGERAAEIFAQALTAKFADSEWPYNNKYFVDSYTKSTKYIRIYSQDDPPPNWDVERPYRAQRIVHAFVDRATGAVYKPAGWKAPAKRQGQPAPDVRYENVWEALVKADRHGSYLYL